MTKRGILEALLFVFLMVFILNANQLPYNHRMALVKLITTGDSVDVYIPELSGRYDIDDTIFVAANLSDRLIESGDWYYYSDYPVSNDLDTVIQDRFGGRQRITTAIIVLKK